MNLSLTKKHPLPFVVGLVSLLAFSACQKEEVSETVEVAESQPSSVAGVPEVISFNDHVRPILNKNCTACHGGVKAAGGVSYLFPELATVKGDSGNFAIKPGSSAESYMLDRIVDKDDPMPPEEHGHMLSETEVAILTKWIDDGAKWGTHWAYIAPTMPEIPEVEGVEVNHAIDRFVARRLQEEGLEFSPVQDKRRLMRRVSLDLTGLLPRDEDYTKYADQPFEDFVDDLLARDSFGERWATMWLDLARYADTMGYEQDAHRNMWPYRDYLIRSFNEDKPYDDFVIEQLAGDLLPNPTLSQIIATGYHRNTQTNLEGGTDDEEFRVAAVIDRNNTTWEVLQGVTMACVQCHSHPYDPFRHEEYYKSYAFFNNSEDADDYDYPMVKVPNSEENYQGAVEFLESLESAENAAKVAPNALAEGYEWNGITPTSLETQGSGKLVLDPESKIIVAEGTIPSQATYRLKFSGSEGPIGALRIETLVEDGKEGMPHDGFVLSQVQMQIKRADASIETVEFFTAYADFDRSDSAPSRVLDGGVKGWAVFPHYFYDHELILVPKALVELAEGDEVELILHHKQFHHTSRSRLKRFRLSATGESDWIELASSAPQLALDKEATEKLAQFEGMGGANLPVMVERPQEFTRNTFLFERGNWMTPGPKQEPGTPGTLHEFKGSNRLDFARWMVSKDSSLTARVIANRLWFELFGAGIVNTLGDFGTFGEKPSHPDLIDYLAVRLMEDHDWHLKPLLKDMVLSRTYQQASQASPELREKDPYNRLLARGPRTRLTAEMVRDQALQAAELLSRKFYGPSVMPPQPDGVWQTVYSGAQWVTSEGEDRYRRAVYTYWKRTSPYPSMLTFDAPTREVCEIQRVDTNTPLQALVRLNDPVYFEAAQAFGKIMAEGASSPAEAIGEIYFRLTAQEPSESSLAELTQLYETSLENYQTNASESKLVAVTPEEAAMTIVANILLNLDETLTK